MKVSKILKKYFKERERNIDLSLKKLRRSFAPQNFHQLRVEIKKIKALHKLISSFAKKFDRDSSFQPYRTIFKAAGKVRELQLHESFLKKNSAPDHLQHYREHLKELKLGEQAKFCQKINKGSLKDLQNSSATIFSSLKKAKKDSLRDYIGKNHKKIKELLCKDRLITDEVHQLRKRLKSLYYVLKIHDSKGLRKELQPMEKLSDTIGKWHDKLVIGQHLQKAMRSAGVNAGDKKTLYRLRMAVSGDRKELFQKINREVKSNCIYN
jgi:CHAD domain-containing protein